MQNTSRSTGPESRYGALRCLRNLILAICLAAPQQTLADAEPVIVALGDSLTQGYGLPADDGFVPQLESWLRNQGRAVRVVNAGVSGDTTAGGRARIGWALAEGADGLIVTLGGNDLLRGIGPETARANLDAILTEAAARGVPVLLVAMQAPGNYGPEYRSDFDAIYPDLAEKHGALLADAFLAPLLEGNSDAAAMRSFMQADGIHPNRDGVTRIVSGLGPRVLDLLDRAADEAGG